MRLIAIVLGEDNAKIRNSEASTLLDYGFNNKQIQLIKKDTDVIKKIKLDKATSQTVSVVPEYAVSILKDKGVNNTKYKTKIEMNKIKLPLRKGDKVGKIIVMDDGKEITSQNLVVTKNVDKLNFFQLFLKNLEKVTTGIL